MMKMIKRNLETEAEDFNVKKPVLAEVSRAFPNISGPRPPSLLEDCFSGDPGFCYREILFRSFSYLPFKYCCSFLIRYSQTVVRK